MARPAADDHRYLYVCAHGNCQLRAFVSHEFAENHRRQHEYEDHNRRKQELEVRRKQELEARRKPRRGWRKASSPVSSSRETGCDEHVGDIVQPLSAQTVQELVDSFSDQQLDATEIKTSMHGGIKKQTKNNTIISPKKVGGRSYWEMLANEETNMVTYRTNWEQVWAPTCGSFEDYTSVTPTLYTYGRIPIDATPCGFLQIFSIQVMENEEWRIRWPVEVYGFIAARDYVDHNRNILFSRTRDDPQILTHQVISS